jgi:hypothetical protein
MASLFRTALIPQGDWSVTVELGWKPLLLDRYDKGKRTIAR